MRIILLGPPGVGKGTQASLIAKGFNIPKISTGDMLRDAIAKGSAIGKKVHDIMERGDYVSEEIIEELITKRLKSGDCKEGYLFDGFPRTMSQIKFLEKNDIHIDYVIEIKVPEEEIISRLSGRRIHIKSGRVYHIKNNPPKVDGIDDITKEPLTHRNDDKPETIKTRLTVYKQQTEPLVDYYKQQHAMNTLTYFTVDGNQDTEAVYKDIEHRLKARNKTNTSYL